MRGPCRALPSSTDGIGPSSARDRRRLGDSAEEEAERHEALNSHEETNAKSATTRLLDIRATADRLACSERFVSLPCPRAPHSIHTPGWNTNQVRGGRYRSVDRRPTSCRRSLVVLLGKSRCRADRVEKQFMPPTVANTPPLNGMLVFFEFAKVRAATFVRHR